MNDSPSPLSLPVSLPSAGPQSPPQADRGNDLCGMEAEDRALLGRWAEGGDNRAILELTKRYTGLVMGTAGRALSGNQLLAEEVAQVVFTVMTAKAGALRNHPSLRLWLHRAALLEAAGMRRREARHRHHLERLAEQLCTVPRSEAAPAWQRALPQLDEAMERLRAGDRLLLMLRFFEGRNFRDIATRLGKSDDTVQKQTTRAVQKLSRLLRQRGAALPVTALAAGLAGIAAVTPEASAALAGKLAAAAIAKAPAFGLAASLNHTLKLMTFTQSTKITGIAAVLLLLLCGLAGYQSGTAAAVESAATGTSGNSETSGAGGNPGKRAYPPGGSPGTEMAAAAPSHPKPPLRDTLKAVAEIEMGINGAWARIPEYQAPLIGYYDIADTEAAIALLPEFRGNDGRFESVAGLIFNVLADVDWRKARDRLLKGDSLRGDGKLSGQAVRLIADAWGREDPAAAFRWANSLVDEGRTPFPADRGLGEGLLTSWFERDPAAALTEMDQRAETQPRLVGPAVRRSLRARPQWWIDQLSPDAPPADRARMLRIARSALVMVPEDKWLESLDSCTKNPEAAKSLLPLLKP